MSFTINKITDTDLDWVKEVFQGWGADFIVSRGKKKYPEQLEGFYAVDDNDKKVGLVTFEIIGDQCEVVTLDAFVKFQGIGTILLNRVVDIAKSRQCLRVWLITLNDNLEAIRFYQKRGMTIAAVHLNALEESRRIKPTIPLIGQHGIPLRDEIEFEILL